MEYQMTMRMTMIIPVVVGLAVGISFVALLAWNFNTFEQKSLATTNDGVVITVNGLETRYPPYKAIDFTVTAKGYGKLCERPIVKLVDADSGEIVHRISSGGLCEPSPQDVDKVWQLQEMNSFPLVVNWFYGTGNYKITVEYNGAFVEQGFIQD